MFIHYVHSVGRHMLSVCHLYVLVPCRPRTVCYYHRIVTILAAACLSLSSLTPHRKCHHPSHDETTISCHRPLPPLCSVLLGPFPFAPPPPRDDALFAYLKSAPKIAENGIGYVCFQTTRVSSVTCNIQQRLTLFAIIPYQVCESLSSFLGG